MKSARPVPNLLLALAALSAAFFGSDRRALAGPYVQADLVSDIPGLATLTDAALKNPWGVSESATSPFWVSNQATSNSTLYTVTGGTNVTKVNINPPSGFVGIPMTSTGPQGPTGQVNNSDAAAFPVKGGDGGSAHFIFANLNGTISAWDTGANAFVQVTTPGAIYTGLAINTAQTFLYAANGSGTGSIDVFDSTFTPAKLPGGFVDPNLPSGYVPFNIQDVGGKLYVAYAPAGRAAQISATPGMGYVDIFGENGVFLQRLISKGQLAAPWGVALAPSSFGTFGGDILVGNFSYVDSVINAFNPVTGASEGSIPIDVGTNSPGGLWALTFGNGGNGGSPNVLYFADGINAEADGLFAALTVAAVPEPSSLVLLTGIVRAYRQEEAAPEIALPQVLDYERSEAG